MNTIIKHLKNTHHYLAALVLFSAFFIGSIQWIDETVWMPAHCSLVPCTEAKSDLTFSVPQRGWHLSLPWSKTVARSYDLDKLAKAIAIHETGNCTASVGSARFNNCHGFRVSGKFLHFKTKADSYAKFKRLWTKKYGDEYPTMRHATCWVCGCGTPTGHDCPGGSPKGWLSSVNSIYASL